MGSRFLPKKIKYLFVFMFSFFFLIFHTFASSGQHWIGYGYQVDMNSPFIICCPSACSLWTQLCPVVRKKNPLPEKKKERKKKSKLKCPRIQNNFNTLYTIKQNYGKKSCDKSWPPINSTRQSIYLLLHHWFEHYCLTIGCGEERKRNCWHTVISFWPPNNPFTNDWYAAENMSVRSIQNDLAALFSSALLFSICCLILFAFAFILAVLSWLFYKSGYRK